MFNSFSLVIKNIQPSTCHAVAAAATLFGGLSGKATADADAALGFGRFRFDSICAEVDNCGAS